MGFERAVIRGIGCKFRIKVGNDGQIVKLMLCLIEFVKRKSCERPWDLATVKLLNYAIKF